MNQVSESEPSTITPLYFYMGDLVVTNTRAKSSAKCFFYFILKYVCYSEVKKLPDLFFIGKEVI